MIPEERQTRILQQLQRDKLVVVRELAQQFSVTNETIRQDLIAMEKNGLASRVHGGAVPVRNDKTADVQQPQQSGGSFEEAAAGEADRAPIRSDAGEIRNSEMPMIQKERQSIILQRLRRDRLVVVRELARQFSVTSETIRQDLIAMENNGLAARVRGGAVPAKGDKQVQDAAAAFIGFDLRRKCNLGNKQKIAEAAANLVKENQTVALDSGTTSYEIAKVLRNRFEKLVIITNSLPTINELAGKKGFTVICTGGILAGDEHSFISDFAMSILEKVHADVMFLTASGISPGLGVTDQRIAEILVHNKMMEISSRVVVAADSSKFDHDSFIKVCSFDQIDAIVTDGQISRQTLEQLEKLVETIIIAD